MKRCLKHSNIRVVLSFHAIFRCSELSPLNKGRSTLALAWVPDGRLFAVGGLYDSYHLDASEVLVVLLTATSARRSEKISDRHI